MDFAIPSDVRKFGDELRAFASSLSDGEREDSVPHEFSRSHWSQCADTGILSLAQLENTTSDGSFLKAVVGMEGFGYGCEDFGLAFGLNAQLWTVQLPIATFGTREQKKKYLESMQKGIQIGAHAVTEEEAGSDTAAMTTTATKVAGGYELSGKKCLISLAPLADIFLVFARTDSSLGRWGVSAFIIEKGTKGLSVGQPWDKMGLRTVPMADVQFDACFVPEDQMLGQEGSGFSILNHALEYDRGCVLASQLGAMQRQLDESVKFARTRKQFGQRIGKFQSVSNRIANMKVRLETARLLLYKVAWLKDQGQSAMMEAAMLKLHLSEGSVHSSLDAILNRGGRGYLTEYGVEKDLRNAVGSLLYGGTIDIQRNIIAKFLGL